MWSSGFPTKETVMKILNQIKEKRTTKFEPFFESLRGLSYLDTEDHYQLEDQIFCFEELEKRGIAYSRPSYSILKCPSCNFHNFCIRFRCVFCKSNNIVQGSAIEHDSCGNIDFDYKYHKADGTMICEKCDKPLKAVGVDYSKIAILYKCLDCKSMHPEIDQMYLCLKCTKFFIIDELSLKQMMIFYVDQNKLSDLHEDFTCLSGIASKLSEIHVKTSTPGYLLGTSKIRHEFGLVVYDNKDIPMLAADIIEQFQNDKDTETKILSFVAKCTDVKISNKILVVIPALKENLKALAIAYGIIVVGSDTKENLISRVSTTINQIYNNNDKATRLVQ